MFTESLAPASSIGGKYATSRSPLEISKTVRALSDSIQSQNLIMRDTIEVLASHMGQMNGYEGLLKVSRRDNNRPSVRSVHSFGRAVLTAYKETLVRMTTRLQREPVSRAALLNAPGPQTERMFRDCRDALTQIGLTAQASDAEIASVRALAMREPFAAASGSCPVDLQKTSDMRDSQLLQTHIAYVCAAYEGGLELQASVKYICRALIVANLPKNESRIPYALKIAHAFVLSALQQVAMHDAAMLTPAEMLERKYIPLAENIYQAHRRANSAAAALVAEEELRSEEPAALRVKAKERRTISQAEAKNAPVRQVDPNHFACWKQYGELSATPDVHSSQWLNLLRTIDRRDQGLAGLRKQVMADVGKSLSAEYHAASVMQQHSEAEAILFTQWFTAFASIAERGDVYRYFTRALHALTEHGLGLPLGDKRDAYFCRQRFARLTEADSLQIRPVEVEAPNIDEYCGVALSADQSSIVLHMQSKDPGDALHTPYGIGYVVSLPTFAKIVQQSAIGMGPVSHTVVASSALLLRGMDEIESKGTSVL